MRAARILGLVTPAILAAAMAAGACSASQSSSQDAPPSSAPVSASVGPTESTTGTTTPEPTTPAPPTSVPSALDCTAGLAGDVERSSQVLISFDEDDDADQVTLYELADNGSAADASWRIRVDTSSGESLDSPIVHRVGSEIAAESLGAIRADGSAAVLIFVAVDSGAASRVVGAYAQAGCELVPVTIDGTPATFPIGGGIGNIAGLECLDETTDGAVDALIAWAGTADFERGEGAYDLVGMKYRLDGASLVEPSPVEATTNSTDESFVFGQLACPGVG